MEFVTFESGKSVKKLVGVFTLIVLKKPQFDDT